MKKKSKKMLLFIALVCLLALPVEWSKSDWTALLLTLAFLFHLPSHLNEGWPIS